MKHVLLAPPLPSALDVASEQFQKNRADMLEQLTVIDGLLDEAEAGGGENAMDRLRSRGKLPVRERIAHVLDPDTPFLEIFARSDEAWAWLDGFLSVEEIRRLLPETAPLAIDRYRLPALRALNFVIHDLLEEGVAAATRQDAQAKGLGEWLRSRMVDIPTSLLGPS